MFAYVVLGVRMCPIEASTVDGHLYELDGRKKFPINHGECTTATLKQVSVCVCVCVSVCVCVFTCHHCCIFWLNCV